MRRTTFAAGLTLALIALSGCVAGITTQTKYAPASSAATPSAGSISLIVIDDRDPKMGGREKNLVGQARGGYGNPFGVRETGNVGKIVTAATTDALAQVGIGVRPVAERTLTATVRKYWCDGYSKYHADIEVAYEVKTPDGKSLANGVVKATQQGKIGMKPKTRIQQLFDDVLTGYVQNAVAEFRSPMVREALLPGGGTEGPRIGARVYAPDGKLVGEVVGVAGDVVSVMPAGGGAVTTMTRAQAIEMAARGR